MYKKKYTALAGVSVATLGLATAALGQTSQDSNLSTAGNADADSGLQQVMVTAQRRTENLQNVPIAITALSSQQLETQQVTSTLDLVRLVPNLFVSNNVGQASANSYYIRGLGQSQSFPTFEPQVGTYVDDIYIARSNASNFALFGVDQLEVLNGPQGTLFGRNSTGGAVVVTLQKPSQTFDAEVSLNYGAWNRVFGHAYVDIPISDKILTRTSVYGITDDGYVQDVTTGQTLNATHDVGVREAIRVLPNTNLTWDLSLDYERNDAANLLDQPSPTGGVNGSDRISYSGFSTDGGALEPYLTGSKRFFGQGALVQSYGMASNVKLSFAAGTLNFITGYRGLDQHLAADFPAAFLGDPITAEQTPTGEIVLAQALRNYQYSQEVKWTAELGERFNYTSGVFYMYERSPDDYGQVLGNVGAPATIDNDQFVTNSTRSAALYAQGDFKVTSQFTVTLGGRFTNEIKTVSARPNAPGEGYTTADVQAAGWLTRLETNQFTPRLALQYEAIPNLMLFASVTKGFQGGGWNGLTGNDATQFNNFGPETIWSYETGFRFATADQRLRFNTTFFYEDVAHYQLLADNPTLDLFLTSNAANMYAYGAEANLAWLPVDRLTLSGTLGSMQAAYYKPSAGVLTQQASCLAGNAANCDAGIVNPSGGLARPIFTPPLTLSLTGSYEIPFEAFTVTPTVSVQYTTREWFDSANLTGVAAAYPAPTGGETKARTLLDVGVTMALRNIPLWITAECKNCTLVDYGVANGLNFDYFNTPGSWDVGVKYKF